MATISGTLAEDAKLIVIDEASYVIEARVICKGRFWLWYF